MILESLDKHDQEGAGARGSEVSELIGVDRGESDGAQGIGANRSESEWIGVDRVAQARANSQQLTAKSQEQEAGGAGLPTKSVGVVDWAKVIDGYRQSQRSEQSVAEQSGDSASSSSSASSASSGVVDAQIERPYEGSSGGEGTGTPSEGAVASKSVGAEEFDGAGISQEPRAKSQEQEAGEGGGMSLEPMDAVEVARERKARAVERVVEGLRDETFYDALMRGVEDPREVQRKREAYRRKGAAWRSMVSLADMVANAIDAYGADRNAYTLERGLGTARYDQMLARELSRLDSEYRLAEGLERDALGKMRGREDRARAVELQDAREALAGAEAERAARARVQAERAKAEEEKKYRANRDKVKDDQWEREFKDRAADRKARRGLQARRIALQARRANGGGSDRGAGRRVFFDVGGKNRWTHELWVPEGSEKEFRESAIKYGRTNANWLIKNNPVYVRTYAEQMGLPTGGASTSDLLRMVRKEGSMDDLYAGLATTSRGFLLSRSVSYGDGEALARVMEETVSPVRGAVVRGISDGDRKRIAGLMAKSIVSDAQTCDVPVGEMYQVYESEMYAGVGDDAVGRVDKFMEEVANCFEK